MLTMTPSPTNYQFPVCAPGNSPPAEPIILGIQGVEFPPGKQQVQIPVSLAFGPISTILKDHPYTAGVFWAELVQTTYQIHNQGFGSPTTIASTPGGPARNPTPNGTITIEQGAVYQHNINVGFNPPAQPLPGLFEAYLTLSGWGGTTTVALTATTSQITVTPVAVGANGVFDPPFNTNDETYQGPFVTLNIDYLSGDDATLNLNVEPLSVSPNVLTVSGTSGISLPPVWVKGSNPLVFGPTPELSPKRSASVTLQASVNAVSVPGKGVAQFQVKVADSDLSLLQPPPTTFNYTLGALHP